MKRGPAGRGGRLTTDLLLRSLGVPALEALDPTTGVDELLLARVEGVALRAELDPQRRHGGPGHELVAAGAVHGALGVVGVDGSLHSQSSLGGRQAPVLMGSDAGGGSLGDLVQELVVALGGTDPVDQ